MTTPVVGVDCTLSVGGASFPALVQNTSPSFNRALQAVILATGDPNNALAGYTPGQATAGFSIATYAFPDTAISLMTALLLYTGQTVIMQFGGAGGVSATGCLTTDIEVSASTGGRAMEIRATFECNSIPVDTGVAAAPTIIERPYYWIDAIHAILLGKTHEDTSGFTMSIKRNIAKYYGRSPVGLPTYLRVTRQEVTGTVDVLLDDTSEIAKALDTCPAIGDISFGANQTCFETPAVGGSIMFTVHDVLYDGIPKFTGDTEQFVSQQVAYRANRGVVTIGAAA